MKPKKNIALLALTILVASSCNNDIKILAPYKNVTIVYGLLDQSDSVHYFRINKGFEGNGSAYTMAQQYDSIYYPVNEITAYLKDSNPSTSTIVQILPLDTTTAIPLGPGTFSYPKQLLYYTKAPINVNDYYNLVLINKKSGQTITGSTSLLPDVAPTNFSSGTFSISFNTMYPTVINWTTSSNVRIYQMTIRFYYTEVYQNVYTPKYLDWIFPPETTSSLFGGLGLSYTLLAENLVSLIAHSIPREEGVTRYPDSLGVIFTSGSDDLNVYTQLSSPPLGINQDIPNFSDVKNGIGLYTARHIQYSYKKMDNQLTDSICFGSETAGLGFQP